MLKKYIFNKKVFLLFFMVFLSVISCFYFYRCSVNLDKTNVILITVDTLRPDHLGCYGYKRNTSPNIDRMAQEGIIFTQAISQSTGTLTSVPSFITSTNPYMHLVDYKKQLAFMNPNSVSLSTVLKKNGYRTVLFTDYGVRLKCIEGIRKDIDVYMEKETDNPQELARSAIDWLKKNKKDRFFIWLYFFGAHGPYNTPPAYQKLFYDDQPVKIEKHLPIAVNAGEVFGVIPNYIAEPGKTGINYYISQYDRKIRFVDEQVGLIFDWLKKDGLDKNTLIILMADHGESLGEHGLYFDHAKTLYDELLKVPLIIYFPEIKLNNKKIKQQIRLMDVVPTIVDMLGINKKKIAVNFDGVSFKSCILDGKCDMSKYAFSKSWFLFSIRTETNKLIYREQKIPNEYELYDIKNDPGEIKNIIIEEEGLFEELKQKLGKYVTNSKIEQSKIKARLKDNGYLKEDKIDPANDEARNSLKRLGYMQ